MLRDGDGPGLREYLIATAARLIAERGTAGLAVRDIAREAQVADGVLYNYFEDKEDLLTHALLAHVGAGHGRPGRGCRPPGTGTVADNLRLFIDGGLDVLARVAPAFAGLLSQPKVLTRFHAMVGGDAAFVGTRGRREATDRPREPGRPRGPAGCPISCRLPARRAGLGRIDEAADIDAAVTLIVGTIHGEILPRVMFAPPGTRIAARARAVRAGGADTSCAASPPPCRGRAARVAVGRPGSR